MPLLLRCRGNNREGLIPPSRARSSPTRRTFGATLCEASAGAMKPLMLHIPDGGEHSYGDEEIDREDNHYMVGHRAPES